jgi:AAA domain
MATLSVSDVFTPRSPEVNLPMYVPRIRHETALLDSIRGSMHTLIFGESGNGKSWLYKKVLEQNEIPYAVANCSSASRKKSLTEEIRSTLIDEGTSTKTTYSEKKEAGVSALVASGKLEHQGQYLIRQPDPLFEAFKAFSTKNRSKLGVLVFDNLESIFSQPTLMDELADIIILLDDSKFAKLKVKLLIVGIPTGVLDYFSQTKNLESVSNRIEEMPRVAGLSPAMVRTLSSRGFNNLLGLGLTDPELEQIANHVSHITLGVAQRVHEYCAKLAKLIAGDRNRFSDTLLEKADRDWLLMGLRQSYTVVESHLNSKKTTIARRNQVIYCIGHLELHQFDSNDIKARVEENFPETVVDNHMGIGSILSELASGKNPLLAKNPSTNEYRIVDPRYLMYIRVTLSLDPQTKAIRKGNFRL